MDNKDRQIFPVLMSKPMVTALKERALESEQSASAIIRKLLIEYLTSPDRTRQQDLGGEFRPYATIECERSAPSPVAAAIICGAPALLHIELALDEPAETFIWQTLKALEDRLAEIGSDQFPFYGASQKRDREFFTARRRAI